MNTLRTDNGPLTIDNREKYRQMLIASQRAGRICPLCGTALDDNASICRYCGWRTQHGYITREPWLDQSIGLWEIVKLTLFAMLMLGGLAEAIAWGLR